jgi:2-desacetyl-2-hydroxyethyl bacteriochlorophyllide A dehydrogenase
MKQAALTAPRTFEIQDAEKPQAGPGEALVRVRSVGVCGTDVHFYRGDLPMRPGQCMGHEMAGDVEAVRAGVTRVAAGDRVAIEPIGNCGECALCRTGRYNLCTNVRSFGLNTPGGLREFMALPAASLYRLPENVDCELGALAEPLAVAVHGLRGVGLAFGERVGILGAGTIGLLTVAAARAMGAGYIAVTARHPHQKAMAEVFGADAVLPDDAEGINALRRALAGGGDVIVETVGGHAETLGQAVTLVAPGGRICVLGLFNAPLQINPLMLTIREASLFFSNCYNRPGPTSDYDVAIEILHRQPETLRRMITHRFPLDRVAEAYATADDKRSGAIKVAVTP